MALHVPPRPFDPARAARVKEALAEQGFSSPEPLLESVFGNSPYLGRLAQREIGALGEYLAAGPETVLNAAILLAHACVRAESEAQAMKELRTAKRRAALAIAMADIAGTWDVNKVTAELTRFADACVSGALAFLLRQEGTRANLAEVAEKDCGLTVLAMGKYGAFELNYSSDIDLVVFYDAAKFPFSKRGDARGAAVDIVRGLVKLLSETTGDGYVFRVDLRLRPDAGATQVAISTDAALDYYEAMGHNWERAAMIKARACAGDPQTGAQFLAGLGPFIWRRHLDFAAIEDIQSIKRQINAHVGHSEIRVQGHNIKLGRGGIREIEFFAQTQQLILGGRHPGLRPSSTQSALDALVGEARVEPQVGDDLKRDYRYLRMLEHRLQMIEDQQTHSIPDSEAGIAHVACFMGYANAADFRTELTRVLENVQGHYARLFESASDLASAEGNLVFTGVEEDPETLKTLSAMGFREPAHASAAIRGWHHGRIRAMRSQRARELLTKLIPAILKALSGAADPDVAFAQFDRFLSNLPSGVQLFSLFLARPHFLDLLAKIVGSAPRLATYLARHPSILDALLDAEFLNRLPSRAELDAQFAATASGSYEEVLDGARRFAREAVFRVGVQVVEGVAKADAAGPAFAGIAEMAVLPDDSALLRVDDQDSNLVRIVRVADGAADGLHHAEDACGGGQKERLEQKLANQLAAAGAKRVPHRDLGTAFECLRQQELRGVRARNQQDERDSHREKHDRRTLRTFPDRFTQIPCGDVRVTSLPDLWDPAIQIRMRGDDIARDGVELGGHAFQGGVTLHSPDSDHAPFEREFRRP